MKTIKLMVFCCKKSVILQNQWETSQLEYIGAKKQINYGTKMVVIPKG